jgi:hypothetical protein
MPILTPAVPSETDRVRRNTNPEALARIDAKIEENIRFYATQPQHAISRRIDELEAEWSLERWLEANASTLALTGVLLGATVSKKWLLLSAGVLGFLLLHAVEGWCPPLPALRAIGIRTRGEIDREKYALKFLRGDFQEVPSDPEELKKSPATEVYRAIRG